MGGGGSGVFGDSSCCGCTAFGIAASVGFGDACGICDMVQIAFEFRSELSSANVDRHP